MLEGLSLTLLVVCQEKTMLAPKTYLVSLLTLTTLCLGLGHGYSYQDLQNLEKNLFRNYTKSIRPLLNQSEVLRVELALEMLDIVSADDVNQELVLRAVMRTNWTDQLLTWTPEQYGDLDFVHPDLASIWTPSIRVAGMDDTTEQTTRWPSNDMLLSDGSMLIRSTGQLTVNCDFDLTFFPFDTQTCTMTFFVQDFTEKEVKLLPGERAISLGRMKPNGQWQIIRGSASTFVQGEGIEAFSGLRLEMEMRRLYLFYVLNVLLPYVLISLLILLAFLVPADGGERATFALTALLAQVVFLNVLTGALPNSSIDVPVVVVFCVALLFLSALAVVTSVLTIAVQHKDHPLLGLTAMLERFACKRLLTVCNRAGNDPSNRPVTTGEVLVDNPTESSTAVHVLNVDLLKHVKGMASEYIDTKVPSEPHGWQKDFVSEQFKTQCDTLTEVNGTEMGPANHDREKELNRRLDLFCLKTFSILYLAAVVIFTCTVVIVCGV